jgi:hypothetical protein
MNIFSWKVVIIKNGLEGNNGKMKMKIKHKK